METSNSPNKEILDSSVEEVDSSVGGSPPPSADTKGKRRRRKKRAKKPREEEGVAVDTEGSLMSVDNMLVRHNEAKGRHGVARETLQAGQVIFEDLPMAFIISRAYKDLYCARCGKYSAPFKLSNDPYHAYCSKDCQVKDAALRVMESDASRSAVKLAEDAEMDCDLLRIVAKMLCRHVINLKEKDEDEIWEACKDLQTHSEKMELSWMESIRRGLEPLLELLPERARVPLDEAVRLACQVNTNAHGISDSLGRNSSVGFGVFPKVALLNHSCKPNAIYTFRDGVMTVRALSTIAAGEEITLHYIDLLQARADRQRELLLTRYFTCTCERCEQPLDEDLLLQAICCADCGTEGVLVKRLPEHMIPPHMRRNNEDDEEKEDTAPAPESDQDQPAANEDSTPAENQDASLTNTPANEEGEQEVNKEETAENLVAQDVPFVPSFLNHESMEVLDAMKALGIDPETQLHPGLKEDDAPPENICFCNLCYKQASQEEIDGFVQSCARQRQEIEERFQRTRSYGKQKEELEDFLENFDAGTPSRKAKPRPSEDEKNKCRLQLHPSHTLIVYNLPQLANACNSLGDYHGAAKHLRRLIKCMEKIQPENFPETADFLYALGDALNNFLAESRLTKKKTEEYRQEARQALIRCHQMRTVCMGADNKATDDAMNLLRAIGGESVKKYVANLPPPPPAR